MKLSLFVKKIKTRLWSTSATLLLVRPAGTVLDEKEYKTCLGEIRWVKEEDLPDCGAFEDADHYVPVYREMLRAGDVVHFGYYNGKCVFRHAAKLSGDIVFQGHVVQKIKENELYTQYGYCAPEARGKGLHAESLYQIFRAFPDYTAYTLVREDNYPSLRGCFRNGYLVHSRITVKYRLFHTSIEKLPVCPEEGAAIMRGSPAT